MKICPRCGAVYDGHKWVPEPDDELVKQVKKKSAKSELCPGDLRLEKGQVEGVVTLKGSFMREHKDDILNLIGRVERNGRSRNVAARIYEMKEDDGEFSIETTDEHLAERIGKELEKAFKGDLEIKWQEKDRFVRVSWQRD
jgi:hypothetical protein